MFLHIYVNISGTRKDYYVPTTYCSIRLFFTNRMFVVWAALDNTFEKDTYQKCWYIRKWTLGLSLYHLRRYKERSKVDKAWSYFSSRYIRYRFLRLKMSATIRYDGNEITYYDSRTFGGA